MTRTCLDIAMCPHRLVSDVEVAGYIGRERGSACRHRRVEEAAQPAGGRLGCGSRRANGR